MCMEYKETKELIDSVLKPVIGRIAEIKTIVEPIPRLVERLTSYKDIESQVTNHDFLLSGTKDKPGIVNDVNELKNQSKKTFNMIVKISAFTGTLLGIAAAIKAFLF